jgi:hypothetical protein
MVDVVRVKPREQVVVSRRDEFLQPKGEIPLQISRRWRGCHITDNRKLLDLQVTRRSL